MAINLSARTQTTGPVSREVFDPNIGFQSGLQEFASGISQFGKGMDTAARSKHSAVKELERKNEIAAKQLAATNYSTYATGMESAYKTLSTLAKDPNASQDQVSEAQAAVEAYKDISPTTIDPNNDADPSYYASYIPRLAATRQSYESDYQTTLNSQRQLKAVTQEMSGISQYGNALSGTPSTAWAATEIDNILATYDPNSQSNIGALVNRQKADETLFQNLQETVTTSINRIKELPVEQQEIELTNLRESVKSLSALDSATAKKYADTYLNQVVSELGKVGTAQSAQRAERENEYTATQVNDADVFAQNTNNNLDPLTGVATPNGGRREAASLQPLPKSATKSQIDNHGMSTADVLMRRSNSNGISYVGEAVKNAIESGSFTADISPDAFTVVGANGQVILDRSNLLENGVVKEHVDDAIQEKLKILQDGISDGDFSVLSRIDSGFAKQWRYATNLNNPPAIRDQAWEALNAKVEEYRANPAYKSLFTGVKAFGIMPEDNGVPFSEMGTARKVEYLQQIADLNGSHTSSVATSLENSGKTSDNTLGVLLTLHLDGVSTQALEDIDRGTSVYSGSVLIGLGEDGKTTLQSSSVLAMYDVIKAQEAPTRLGMHILAARRLGNNDLAEMYEKIEASQIASTLGLNPRATPNEVYANLLEIQTGYINSLGNKLLSSNSTVLSLPTFDTKDPVHKSLKKYFQRPSFFTGGLTDRYAEATSSLLVDALVSRNIDSTPFLEMVAQSENNPALRTALSEKLVNGEKEAIKFARGLTEKTNALGVSYVDYSQVETIDGIDYIIPRFKEYGSNKYRAFVDVDNNNVLRISLNALHRSVYKNLEQRSERSENLFSPFRFLTLNTRIFNI